MVAPLSSLIDSCWLLTAEQKMSWHTRLVNMSSPQKGRLREIFQQLQSISPTEAMVAAQSASERAALIVSQLQIAL